AAVHRPDRAVVAGLSPGAAGAGDDRPRRRQRDPAAHRRAGRIYGRLLRDRPALAGARGVNAILGNGADMRSIYMRSLRIAFGLAAFVAIELLAPTGVVAAAPRPAAVGTPRGAA